MKKTSRSVADIAALARGPIPELVEKIVAAMSEGVDVIFHACLQVENRDADVVNAVESVIFYEKWKLTRDPAILDAIRDYKEDDCRSTFLLHTWLLSIKPASAAFFLISRMNPLKTPNRTAPSRNMNRSWRK